MSLRVGYVNVRGLTRSKWKACHRLLDSHFDFLFIAETWFIEHKEYVRNRRFITSTIQPPVNLHGRQRGGVYLIGSYEARSKVGQYSATEHTITFSLGKIVITGVYFPPTTLDSAAIGVLLNSLRGSTMILGDINTRFRDPLYQAGQPGPPERLGIMTEFLARTRFQHLKPVSNIEKLTTDHVFIRTKLESTLKLDKNGPLGINTDHKYTLDVTLGSGQQDPGRPDPSSPIKRFRIRQLAEPEQQQLLCDRINGSNRPFLASDDLEDMNAKLVDFCQRVQEQTIGQAFSQPGQGWQSVSPSPRQQTIQASIRLYKHASQSSKENEIIFPTPEAVSKGLDAAAENLAILQERWSGRPFRPLPVQPGQGNIHPWTREQIVEEIQEQEAEKSCGADGIHIRFLKVARDTPIITWLRELYNRCLLEGRTPPA